MDDECVEELGRPISSLKVAELRDELTKRALTKTGNKKELIDRLRVAIQRQATQQHQQQQQMCGTTADLSINQQVNQQQQNVPQYMNPVVAMQQNQVAAAYQHQLNQINQPQAAQLAAYTLNQQQYQKTVMQPLDLQQQLAGYPTQVQFVAADYQQQPQQLQQQQPLQLVIESQQQYQGTANQPAIDMRVVQQAQQSTGPDQSIDLSSNTKQLTNKQKVQDELEKTTSHDMTPANDQPKDEINEPKLADQIITPQKDTKSQDDQESGQKSSVMIEEKPEEQNTITGASDHPPKSPMEESNENPDLPTEIQDQSAIEQSSTESAKTLDSSSTTPTAKEAESTSQTSISLKRGLSDSRTSLNSGNKEKRRKWSSKTTVTGSETSQDVVDGSQLNILTGGISSNKLKELIIEKPVEATNKAPKSDAAETLDESSKQEIEADKILEKPAKVKDVEQEQTQKDTIVSRANESQPVREPDLPELEQEPEPTNVLLIRNLVRPFTLSQLKEVLTKHGSIIEEKFWIDKVKSKCCVMFESLEVAQQTKESLNAQQWPSSNPKTLKITYITEEILEKFKLSDSKATEKAEAPENGNNNEAANKSISDRLGERLDDGDIAMGTDLKKRLGDKVAVDVSTKQSSVNREGGGSTPQKLDDLFKKTEAVPHLFWLPLTDDLADVRQKERKEREALREANKKARKTPPKRSRHRSPPARRSPPKRSPQRHRSPVSRRSPINRRSPVRHRSPMGRRSPTRRRTPIRNRGPMLRRSRSRSPMLRRSRTRSPMLRRSRSRSPMLGTNRPRSPMLGTNRARSPMLRTSRPRSPMLKTTRPRSPMLRRSRSRSPMLRRSRSRSPMLRRSRSRSPMLRRSRSRSPMLRRRSPALLRRSPARRSPIRRSPGPIRRSPMLRRSPGPIRRSPGLMARRSPLLVRRSPGQVRRSPPMIRRSPAPIRGSSPSLIRRSPRRNSPPRHMSPNRNVGNYGPPDHRRIR